jgi:hypothetical protein
MTGTHVSDSDGAEPCTVCGARLGDPDRPRQCLDPIAPGEEGPASATPAEPAPPAAPRGFYAGQRTDRRPAIPPTREPELWPERLSPAAQIGLVGDILAAVGPHWEADPAGIVLTTLVISGWLQGPTPRLDYTPSCPANLFGLLVGATAEGRKGTTFQAVAEVASKVDPTAWRHRLGGGYASGEVLAKRLMPPDDTEPGSERQQHDARLLSYAPEFASVLVAANRDGSLLSPTYRQIYDGETLRHDSLTHGSHVAEGHHVGVMGHITPAELRLRMSSSNMTNGFGNRFVMFAVRRRTFLGRPTPVPPEVCEELAGTWRHLLERARRRPLMRMSPAAWDLWHIDDQPTGLYRRLDTVPRDSVVGELSSRGAEQARRLALNYAVLDGSDLVEPRHLLAGAEIVRYSRDTLRMVFGDSDQVAGKLWARLAEAGPEGLTLTEQSAVFGRNVSKARLEEARGKLLAGGQIEVVPAAPPGGRGRPPTRHRVVTPGVEA